MGAVAPIDRITLTDVNGVVWCLQSPDPTEWGAEGIKLLQDGKGLDGVEFKTIQNSGAFQDGADYGGTRYEPTPVIVKVRVYDRPGRPKAAVESRWRQGWATDRPCTLTIERVDEGTVRHLPVQLKERIQRVTSGGKDRNLFPQHELIMTTLAYWPWWESATAVQELETAVFTPDPSPNRIADPGFNDLITLWWTGGGWTKDTGVGHTAPGSMKTSANGSVRQLRGKSIPARSGQVWDEFSCWVKWSGVTAVGGAAISMLIEARNGGEVLSDTIVGTVVPGAASDWIQFKLTGWTAPVGCTNLVPRIVVSTQVLLGSVWVDDVAAYSAATWTATMNGTVWNPTDRPGWLQWTLSAAVPTVWQVPDYSWGSDQWGLADEHAARMITLKQIEPGQELDIDTYPLHERIVADDNSLQWARQNAVDFLYPVPAYTPPTTVTIKATVADASQPVGAILHMPRQWSMPDGLVRDDIPVELVP